MMTAGAVSTAWMTVAGANTARCVPTSSRLHIPTFVFVNPN